MSIDLNIAQGNARRGSGVWSFAAGAVVVGVLLYVWQGSDGLLYPYHLVRSSFIHANAWAIAQHGPWLKRLFYVLEVLAVAWFVAAMLVGGSAAADARHGGAIMLVVLAVACLPLAPFVWELVDAYGFISPQEAAFIVRNNT